LVKIRENNSNLLLVFHGYLTQIGTFEKFLHSAISFTTKWRDKPYGGYKKLTVPASPSLYSFVTSQ
jgi:hypothetical protein